MKNIITKRSRAAFLPIATAKANELAATIGGKVNRKFVSGSPVLTIAGGKFPAEIRLNRGTAQIMVKKSFNPQCKEKAIAFSVAADEVVKINNRK